MHVDFPSSMPHKKSIINHRPNVGLSEPSNNSMHAHADAEHLIKNLIQHIISSRNMHTDRKQLATIKKKEIEDLTDRGR